MSTKKTNNHPRQMMWCDGCKEAVIEPFDDYTQMGSGNFCQACIPIDQTAKAGALR